MVWRRTVSRYGLHTVPQGKRHQVSQCKMWCYTIFLTLPFIHFQGWNPKPNCKTFCVRFKLIHGQGSPCPQWCWCRVRSFGLVLQADVIIIWHKTRCFITESTTWALLRGPRMSELQSSGRKEHRAMSVWRRMTSMVALGVKVHWYDQLQSDYGSFNKSTEA